MRISSLSVPEEMVDYVLKYSLTNNDLVRSYANCAKLGLKRDRSTPKIILPRSEVRQIRKKQRRYLKAALPILKEVYRHLPADFVCFLTDQQLINLFTIADSEKRAQCRRIGLCPGTDFSERSAGTNAISMCYKLKRTVVLFGPQHYLIDLFGKIWCVAGEVRLPNGELLWVFDVSASTKNDLRMAFLVVNLATKQLEQAVAEVWHQWRKPRVMLEVAASLAAETLTEREKEVLLGLLEDKTYVDIGSLFSLAPGTVNTYVSRIYKKMCVGGREELKIKLATANKQKKSK